MKGYHYLSRICCVFIVLFWRGDMLCVCVCVRTRSMYAYHLESIMYLYCLYMCIELMSFAISECRWTWHEMMVWDGFLPVYGPQHWPKCPQRMRRSLRRSRMGGNPGDVAGWVGWSYSNGPPNPWLLNWWIFLGVGGGRWLG